MNLAEFRASFPSSAPPAGLAAPLLALWWMGKGDWDKAHHSVDSEDGPVAAWVHAHLHRVEGDLSNAAYWYRRASKPVSTAPLESEWTEITTTLLAR